MFTSYTTDPADVPGRRCRSVSGSAQARRL